MPDAAGGGGRQRPLGLTGRVRLARQTPVSICQDLLAIEPLIASLDEDLLALMHRAVAQPATRLVGVVDADGRLAGVLPIVRLAESVIARVVPEALLSGITDVADVARFGHTVEARTAGEAMLPPATIAPAATVAEAFREMHARRLSGLYVVDAAGRPTGYLDLLELALVYTRALEQEHAPGTDATRAAEPPSDPTPAP